MLTDKQMIEATDQWPYEDFLPVKRYNSDSSWPDLGVILRDDKGSPVPVVFRVSMFEMNGVDWEQIKRDEFDSFDDLLKAGWLVD